MSREVADGPARDRILRAATPEFIEKGLAGARMREIASRAEVNQALLHYYFGDKANLYLESLAYLLGIAFARLNAIRADELNRLEFITSVVNEYMAFMQEYPGLLRMVLQEVMSGGKTIGRVLRQHHREALRHPDTFFFIRSIRSLQDRHEIRDDIEPMHLILSLIGLMASSFIQEVMLESVLPTKSNLLKDFIERRKAVIIQTCDRGLAPEPDQSTGQGKR